MSDALLTTADIS